MTYHGSDKQRAGAQNRRGEAMRMLNAMRIAAVLAAAVASQSVWAQETFDACDVFTQDDAQKALGTAAAGEPVNPKVKRPKVIPACTYNGFKDGKAVAATALFRFGKTDSDPQRAFDHPRMHFQTTPLLTP